MDRAYALLNVKAVNETATEWVITGVASTPTTDRMGDQVDPMGAKFKTPMPLLDRSCRCMSRMRMSRHAPAR